jgi:putative FmdB family regulatory protein
MGPVPVGVGPFDLKKTPRRNEVPTYEYACDTCLVIYQTRHAINGPRPEHCPKCKGELRKVLSAPSLNTGNHSSPTQAKYAKVSESDEIAKEKELQKIYETVWIPPEVKHNPWDHDH